MEKQPSSRSRLSAWHEWNVPPLWVFVVGGLVLIGISTVIFMKIGESMSASHVPATPVTISDQAGEGATLGGTSGAGAPDPRL